MPPSTISPLTHNPNLAVLLTTAPPAAARDLARALVNEGLAACVNLLPGCHSIYVWEGKLCEEEELLCVIKTQPPLLAALNDRLQALHPYELPEVVVLPVASASAAYQQWVAQVTDGTAKPL